jgi:hypothetical protein
VEFEVNIIVVFRDSFLVTENFPITLYREPPPSLAPPSVTGGAAPAGGAGGGGGSATSPK